MILPNKYIQTQEDIINALYEHGQNPINTTLYFLRTNLNVDFQYSQEELKFILGLIVGPEGGIMSTGYPPHDRNLVAYSEWLKMMIKDLAYMDQPKTWRDGDGKEPPR